MWRSRYSMRASRYAVIFFLFAFSVSSCKRPERDPVGSVTSYKPVPNPEAPQAGAGAAGRGISPISDPTTRAHVNVQQEQKHKHAAYTAARAPASPCKRLLAQSAATRPLPNALHNPPLLLPHAPCLTAAPVVAHRACRWHRPLMSAPPAVAAAVPATARLLPSSSPPPRL